MNSLFIGLISQISPQLIKPEPIPDQSRKPLGPTTAAQAMLCRSNQFAQLSATQDRVLWIGKCPLHPLSQRRVNISLGCDCQSQFQCSLNV